MSTTSPERSQTRARKAFTLVELLVVIGIIALLISILLPSLHKARNAATSLKCAAQLKEIVTACAIYVTENKGYLPPIAARADTVNPGLGNYSRPTVWPVWSGGGDGILNKYLKLSAANLFVCPSLATEQAIGQRDGFSYRYHRQLGGDDHAPGTNHFLNPDAGGVATLLPWKASQVKQSSQQALIIEGTYINAPSGAAANRMSFEQGVATAGRHMVNEPWHVTMHPRKMLGGTYPRPPHTELKSKGPTNIAFVDGSVRTIRVRFDEWPTKAWEDVLIDPYKRGEPTW